MAANATEAFVAKKEVKKPGVDSWVVDTGSGHHLIAKTLLTSNERGAQRKTTDVLQLSTANGTCRADVVTDVLIKGIDEEAEVRVLNKTPRVLSVHKLVERGGEFCWNDKGAFLKYNGITYELDVQKGVPLMTVAVAHEANQSQQ